MWFKNLQLYRLPSPWNIQLETLETALAKRPFVRCGSQDMASRGFVSPNGSDVLVFASNRQWLIALRTEQKLLPSSVVKEVAQDRAEEIEAQQGYKPGRKQMKEIKEAVTQELLPRAFTRRRTSFAWIDPLAGWLAVDAASASKADELLEALRDVLDDLPLRLLDTERSPVSSMADWLAAGEAPPNFTLDRDCELRAVSDEKAAVRYVRHPLEGEEIPAHLAAGKVPTRLALSFDDRLSFVLTEKLEIKRLAFLDIVQEEAEKATATGDEQFEADFVLMTAELARFIPELVAALGGERKNA
ncbi:MAG: recombination-associated protein RdgC [Betaproteobacteria bacterium]|nr:recombination-associated protein RdgC [Betaproteobacteria bacterium]